MRVHTLQYIDVQVSRLLEKYSRSFASSSSHGIPSSETPANAIQMPDPNPYSYTSFSGFTTPSHPYTISRPTSTSLFPTPGLLHLESSSFASLPLQLSPTRGALPQSALPATSLISSNLLPIFTKLYRIILGSSPNVLLTACCVLALESKRRMK